MPCDGTPARASRFAKFRRNIEQFRSRVQKRVMARGRAQGRAKKLQQAKKMMCMRPGPVTRNPYLNFMREFRKKNCDLSFTEMGAEGGKRWRAMKASERRTYEEMAERTRSEQTHDTNMVCMRPGPVTRNPYLNFMREFRKKNCDLSFTEMGAEGGKRWRAMKAPDRKVYEQMAESTPKKERRQRARFRR